MSSALGCPDEQTLQKFATGNLDPAAVHLIQKHVADCLRCGRCLEQMASSEESETSPQSQPEETQSYSTQSNTPPADLDITSELAPTRHSDSTRTHQPGEVGHAFDSETAVDLNNLSPSPIPNALGRIGDHDILTVVGRGGMGVVFRAFEERLNRTVAIKILASRLASSPEARLRFTREAQAAAGISHPNVVTIHAVADHRGIPYLVMEYVKGPTLFERIRQTPAISIAEFLDIAVQIAAGLAAAHAKGVIHRDIKPANILLESGTRRVKITDFGLARVSMDHSELTTLGHVVGTPAYMSPEQVNGYGVDYRSDLFSLGSVLYALLSGHSPFQGSHAVEISKKVATLNPPQLHKLLPQIPKPISDLIDRLLEKDPDDRYQSADEVAQQLHGYGAEFGSLLTHPLPSIPLNRHASPPRRASRLRPKVLASLGVAVLVVTLVFFRQWLPIDTPVPTPPVEVPPTHGLLTVSKHTPADCSGLRQALDRALDGATIRILDSEVYTEPLIIANPKRRRGLTIEADPSLPQDARPRLTNTSGPGPVITIDGVPDVTVRGFDVAAAADQHAVVIRGAVDGLALENLTLSQEPESSLPVLKVENMAHGSEKAPIVIRGCKFECSALGQCIWIEGAADVASGWCVIEHNRFAGPGTHLVLWGAMHDIAIRNNLFCGTRNAINVNFAQPDFAQAITIANNTTYKTVFWLGLVFSTPQQQTINIRNNLILGANRVETSDGQNLRDFSEAWNFDHNVWETGPTTAPFAGLGGSIAEMRNNVPLMSRDTDDPNYLRPPKDSDLGTLGESGGVPAYVGAIPPASQ